MFLSYGNDINSDVLFDLTFPNNSELVCSYTSLSDASICGNTTPLFSCLLESDYSRIEQFSRLDFIHVIDIELLSTVKMTLKCDENSLQPAYQHIFKSPFESHFKIVPYLQTDSSLSNFVEVATSQTFNTSYHRLEIKFMFNPITSLLTAGFKTSNVHPNCKKGIITFCISRVKHENGGQEVCGHLKKSQVPHFFIRISHMNKIDGKWFFPTYSNFRSFLFLNEDWSGKEIFAYALAKWTCKANNSEILGEDAEYNFLQTISFQIFQTVPARLLISRRLITDLPPYLSNFYLLKDISEDHGPRLLAAEERTINSSHPVRLALLQNSALNQLSLAVLPFSFSSDSDFSPFVSSCWNESSELSIMINLCFADDDHGDGTEHLKNFDNNDNTNLISSQVCHVPNDNSQNKVSKPFVSTVFYLPAPEHALGWAFSPPSSVIDLSSNITSDRLMKLSASISCTHKMFPSVFNYFAQFRSSISWMQNIPIALSDFAPFASSTLADAHLAHKIAFLFLKNDVSREHVVALRIFDNRIPSSILKTVSVRVCASKFDQPSVPCSDVNEFIVDLFSITETELREEHWVWSPNKILPLKQKNAKQKIYLTIQATMEFIHPTMSEVDTWNQNLIEHTLISKATPAIFYETIPLNAENDDDVEGDFEERNNKSKIAKESQESAFVIIGVVYGLSFICLLFLFCSLFYRNLKRFGSVQFNEETGELLDEAPESNLLSPRRHSSRKNTCISLQLESKTINTTMTENAEAVLPTFPTRLDSSQLRKSSSSPPFLGSDGHLLNDDDHNLHTSHKYNARKARVLALVLNPSNSILHHG